MFVQEIIDSKNKLAVVTLLSLAPARAFSVVELSKRLGIPQTKLLPTLSDLARQGVLVKITKSSFEFYKLDQKYKYLKEIRQSLIKGGMSYDDELCKAVAKLGDVKAAFLSGLFTGNPQLPVDLLLVGKINLAKLIKFLQSCKKMMGPDINYSVMSEQEFLLRRDTFDRFIKDIFDYAHVVVVDHLGQPKKHK